MELVRVPYLLDYRGRAADLRGADPGPATRVGKHIAPHAACVAALWAVLTRMRKPLPEKYPKALADLVAKLAPLEKARALRRQAHARGADHRAERSSPAAIDKVARESDAYPNYEGRTGASPREMKMLITERGAEPASTPASRRSRCSTRWRSWSRTSPSTSSSSRSRCRAATTRTASSSSRCATS